MRPLRERLALSAPILFDGAMGTELQGLGLGPGECPEAWNLERPEAVAGVARAYREAGSEVVETNTFGASPLRLASYGLEGRAGELNRLAVAHARAGSQGLAYVAGSIGPSGGVLKPYGDTEPELVLDSFRLQAAALAAAGADLLVIETMIDLEEACLALAAAREAAGGLPVAVTMTFERTPRGYYTPMGAAPEEAARRLSREGADIVGSNCGNGLEAMAGIASVMAAASGRPVLIQANAGLPELRGGKAVYPESPGDFARLAGGVLASGAALLGGCCGTTPEHIRELRGALEGRAGPAAARA